MSNEKIRALMAKVSIIYMVYSISELGVLTIVAPNRFKTEPEAEAWILEHIEKIYSTDPLTIIKAYE